MNPFSNTKSLRISLLALSRAWVSSADAKSTGRTGTGKRAYMRSDKACAGKERMDIEQGHVTDLPLPSCVGVCQ